ncbi:SGNH/GDSL hydrolase family protein [Paenibacillus qinlingensis]|uniref:SGNH/GDSL hydrolase family protein n=1 Tax=Paenibacillus qinlingensis TaxID=1837343 RepID=UPI0015630E04|nr:SGNH/GDSL hydrolase family protein [Paenibacillus qinlingensis]NQX62659.1 SGNH/GDSL hydrolase family protein [Paenibacillus qinlingensis]
MELRSQMGEAFVFPGTEKQKMRYRPYGGESGVQLRSHPDALHPDNRQFQQGIDYMVDGEDGTIYRMARGAIPNWAVHPLYGQERFDHRDYEKISNATYTVYADYDYKIKQVVVDEDRVADASNLMKRLQEKPSISLVVLGDSITMGAEIPDVKFTFAHRFAEQLHSKFSSSEVTLSMKAIGGETSGRGLLRLQEDVIASRPDVVTIGYGMNDQNGDVDRGNSVPPSEFEQHIAAMIEQLRAQTDAAIILITPCLPNPSWHFASRNVAEYADSLRRLAIHFKVALADVQKLWVAELAAGKSNASLLMNNVNHPNEYGHSLYARALAELL